MQPDKDVMSHLDRLAAIAMGADVPLGHPEDTIRSECPTLWEVLARTKVNADRVKSPARITLQLTPGGVAVAVMDAGLAWSMDWATDHLLHAFQALEEVLKSPNPPIRIWDGKEPKLRKRREAA